MRSKELCLGQYFSSCKSVRALGFLFVCLSFVTGCAAPPNTAADEEQSKSAMETMHQKVDDELARGDREKAVALLTKAAKEDSEESTELWLRIANIRFDAGDYPASILAANEVLQRDAVNQKAKSILVVAGLRVAAGAINGLRESGAIATSERVQAQNLTNSLRDILGEKILVPVPAPVAEEKPVVRPVHKYVRPHRMPSPNLSAKAPTVSAGSSADPFKSLK